MRSTKSVSLTKRFLPCTLYVLSPISLLMAFLCLCFFNQFFTPYPQTQYFHHYPNSIGITSPPLHSNSNSNVITSYPPPPPPPRPPPPPPPPSPPTEMVKAYYETPCDYSNGKWVRQKRGPLYNGTTCSEIKASQNCIANGRPDSEYLYWRWKPNQCHLPRFEPRTFLHIVKNRHIAFVGDSVAKNQFDSLICMLATASTPNHISHHRNGWHFPSHNADLSFYWSPFLVEGVQRTSLTGPNYYNTMYLDRVNEKWARDMDQIDLIVLSLGHWFSDVPSVYYEGGSVLGCRNCPRLNCANVDFYGPLRKALRTALNSIIEKKAAKGDRIDVIVRTYSPSHFEGAAWDKGGTCKNTWPRRKGKKKLHGVDAAIRRIEMEEVEIAKAKAKQVRGFRIEAMDVTKLAWLRPDGHPGAYYKNLSLFANRVPKHVQNDCVHWCLPGPIDTWNVIFLEMMKKWVV